MYADIALIATGVVFGATGDSVGAAIMVTSGLAAHSFFD